MMILAKDRKTTIRQQVKGGPGMLVCLDSIGSDAPLKPEETGDRIKILCEMEIPVGCGIGPHDHKDDAEFYYLLEGELECTDNGTTYQMKPGDCSFACGGSSHELYNHSSRTARILTVYMK